MKTFFVTFQVSPTLDNEHYAIIGGGEAHCLIVENNPQSAFIKAKFFTEKGNWTIDAIETSPIEVNEENFLERDIGLELYREAQKEKIAIAFVTWAKDENLITEPTLLEFSDSRQFNPNEWLTKQKQLKQKGRCLHYDSGIKCNEIIGAHSIQKNQSLSAIADNGKVYTISGDFSDLKKHVGIIYKKRGIETQVSVFRGFCQQHDNELFEPIDNSPLVPTDQQVFLYAYRSLCKELFAKQNSFDLIDSQLKSTHQNKANKEFLESYQFANIFGLDNLKKHKLIYDKDLKLNTYSDMKYVLFISKQKPCIAFSGLFYPDFDFMGRQLQDLGNQDASLELITMCFAPMLHGEWGFLFAWHKTSSNVCIDFMRSLATMVSDGNKLSDFLFRLVLSLCENHAIAPQWWEKLSETNKEQISLRASSMADPMSMTEPNCLMKGLEGIVQWEFEECISNIKE